jgi:uncharacterized membrane protein YdbT with pleckstrin-like domain
MADLRLQEGEEVLFEAKPGSWLTFGMYFWTLGLYSFWRRATHFALTDQRVIQAKGVVSKSQKTLPLDMVQDATVTTALGAGGLNVSTAGGGQLSQLRLFPMRSEDASHMSEMIIDLRNKKRSASAPAAAPTASPPPAASGSSADRLRELERLRSEGLLTDDEYAAKRAEALKDL